MNRFKVMYVKPFRIIAENKEDRTHHYLEHHKLFTQYKDSQSGLDRGQNKFELIPFIYTGKTKVKVFIKMTRSLNTSKEGVE